MREPNLMTQFDVVAATGSPARRRPFADAVDGQNRRLVEGAGEKSARCMGFVMLAEHDSSLVSAAQVFADLTRQMQLGLQPGRHRAGETTVTSRRVGQVGLEQTIE